MARNKRSKPAGREGSESANPRRSVVQALVQVLAEGRSLGAVSDAFNGCHSGADQALFKELLWGCLRQYYLLDALLSRLLERSLKKKDADVKMVLVLGLYQIEFMRTPDYAAVNESVALCNKLKKRWASGMVNAVLRNYVRQRDTLMHQVNEEPQAHYRLPLWLLSRLQEAWPDDWQAIARQSSVQPPLTLRVNLAKQSREDYLQQLQQVGIEAEAHQLIPSAVVLLQSVNVTQLPGFDQGLVSVQDGAPQLAAALLAPVSEERVLDACAAPGGKTMHLAELVPNLSLHALDVSESRLQRVQQNLDRGGFQAKLIVGDAATPQQWWDGELFDAILLDVPCSATGVIRRNPDIRYHRTADDIQALTELQTRILDAAWPLLRTGGRLLYATCSILPAENSQQVEAFIQRTADAVLVPMDDSHYAWGRSQPAGRQILTGEHDLDGFYYALLEKQPLHPH